MGKLTILTLRLVLAAVLAGTLFVQAFMVPLLAIDLAEAGPGADAVRIPVIVLVVLGIIAVQVVLVSVWRLLTMARRGTVFSSAAFRYVDVVIGAVTAGALLLFALGIVLAPGEGVAPGIVLLIGGAGLAVAGVALIVLVLRALLAQAVAINAEATQLRTELDEVI
ncbi:DUF2975 domain-containing protein [Arthrobacter sp. zg-Y820]|uniref:DUF2975 domain-containing protein n=1 Tax=unclassified Arthrobacter TaxID=235627 RepID=UPI001E3B0F93|nr:MULTISPECIES: DUF2975 domain-containing protein [unclassified Arthrobacter]MCC9198457.1 DUF2975 domain-containing protein [Arthrobacter sp. zg-Y820]MDK1281327.1 DUF2975 domain-containing protein [Arthrobacter sp. zg.Y820]WIB09959.1 DUF2975 domain-containing protein [Arthrobacter sp. zg-Y820]